MRGRGPAAALVGLLASALPAAAQQVPDAWAPLPHPTDTGKPPVFDPQFAAKADNDRHLGCAPGLQCRFQLLGVIQNNGAVELRTTAFSW
jgi:hypothetical protein